MLFLREGIAWCKWSATEADHGQPVPSNHKRWSSDGDHRLDPHGQLVPEHGQLNYPLHAELREVRLRSLSGPSWDDSWDGSWRFWGGVVLPGMARATLGKICREYLNGTYTKTGCKFSYPLHNMPINCMGSRFGFVL